MRAVATFGLFVAAMLLASCSTEPESHSAPDPHQNLVLSEDGIGPFHIGDAADEVINGLSRDIGGWDGDSSEEDSSIRVPDCGTPGTRLVSWGNLILIFVDSNATSVFHTWSYGFDPITGNAEDFRKLGLRTAAGIGLDSTRTDLESGYRARLNIDDDVAIDLATFTIDGSRDEHMAGSLWSTSSDALVQLIERAPSCNAPSG